MLSPLRRSQQREGERSIIENPMPKRTNFFCEFELLKKFKIIVMNDFYIKNQKYVVSML